MKSNKIDVIIVAAGKGTRMQPYTFEKPKPLVPIQGKSLIQHQIDAFKNLKNVDKFIIVTGYMRNSLYDEVTFKNLGLHWEKKLKFVYASNWKDSECGASMMEGIKNSKNDVICIIGDTLITQENAKLLVENKNNCLLVRNPKPAKIGQKVRISNKFIDDITLGGYNSYEAEAVGPFKLKFDDVIKLTDHYNYHLDEDEKLNVHCYSLLGLYVQEYKMIPLFINDDEWMEIDNQQDWELANRYWKG